MAVIDGVTIKDQHIVMPETLQQQALKQLHINHMGTEKNKLLACESVYWVGIYADIENHIKMFYKPSFQQTQPREKIIHHNIPAKSWEVVGADTFTLNNKYYLFIVDYHSKFPNVKRAEDMSVESLILACKVIFSKYGLTKRIMSDAGGNFISDKFRQFCKCMNIEQVTSSSYHHQINSQVEVCIKLMKGTIKNALKLLMIYI